MHIKTRRVVRMSWANTLHGSKGGIDYRICTVYTNLHQKCCDPDIICTVRSSEAPRLTCSQNCDKSPGKHHPPHPGGIPKKAPKCKTSRAVFACTPGHCDIQGDIQSDITAYTATQNDSDKQTQSASNL